MRLLRERGRSNATILGLWLHTDFQLTEKGRAPAMQFPRNASLEENLQFEDESTFSTAVPRSSSYLSYTHNPYSADSPYNLIERGSTHPTPLQLIAKQNHICIQYLLGRCCLNRTCTSVCRYLHPRLHLLPEDRADDEYLSPHYRYVG